MNEKFFQNKQAIIILIAAALVVLVSMGIRQTWGLFYGFFETDLGFSRTQFGLAIAIQMVFWGSLAPIFGFFADKFGPSKVVAFAFLIYIVGVYSLIQEPKTTFGFQTSLGVLIGIALGGTAMSVPVSAVGKFFSNKNRTIATGIVTASASVGFFLLPMFTKFSNQTFGWKGTLEYYIYFLIFGLLCSLFLIKKEYVDETNNPLTRDQSASKALQEAFQHKGYKLLTAGFFVCGFQITLVATHIPGYIKQTGLPDWTAAAILSLIGLFNIFGTLGMGYLSSKYSKKILLSWLYFLRAIAILLFLLFPTSIYVALGFGVVFGVLWLATIPPTNGIVAQIFGTKYLTTLFGIVFFSHQIGSFLGAYLGGYFYDHFGSYDYAWYLSILLSIFAGLVHLPIDEKPIVRVAPIKA
ncbi:MAG: MFS transporter [Candidatus Pelagibacter sp.]|nr:MFS transporter [Candidatus Pelagibacter sp.]